MERCTGQTTRLVDFYIQELFTKGSISPKDHYGAVESDKYLMRMIERRLKSEHPNVVIKTNRIDYLEIEIPKILTHPL